MSGRQVGNEPLYPEAAGKVKHYDNIVTSLTNHRNSLRTAVNAATRNLGLANMESSDDFMVSTPTREAWQSNCPGLDNAVYTYPPPPLPTNPTQLQRTENRNQSSSYRNQLSIWILSQIKLRLS